MGPRHKETIKKEECLFAGVKSVTVLSWEWLLLIQMMFLSERTQIYFLL